MTGYSDSFKKLESEFFTYETAGAPQVIVFTPLVSNRLVYACDFIFKQGLKINYTLTGNPDEFLKSGLAKINYSDQEFEKAINILPSGLLFETGIRKLHPKGDKRGELIYFFSTPGASFHFDIFSAVFYFISRYEEHLSYVKDLYGRFEIRASLLYLVSYYRTPLLDKWILELKDALLRQKNTIVFPVKKLRYLSTIDVDNVYAFKTKPFGRMAGANLKDFLNLNFANISQRFQTRYLKRPDPFDAYKLQMDVSEQSGVPLVYFFLCRNNTAYDRSINPSHPMLKQLLHSITERKVPVGLHPSYFSSEEPGLFEKEIKLLRNNSGQQVDMSRQHYLRFNIKDTPKQLIALGVKYDYTMGYSSEPGYRAGTTLPFYYYDFENEKPFDLLAVPFVIMDGAYYLYKKMGVQASEQDIHDLAEEARKVNGLFVTVFHDRTFWIREFPGWKQLYVKLQEMYSLK